MTDPYMLLVSGINDAVANDHRFDTEVRRALAAQGVGGSLEAYIGDLPVPEMPDPNFDLVDLVTGQKLGEKRPTFSDVLYEGSPLLGPAWRGDSSVTGYEVAGCYDDNLLRALALAPGFFKLFGDEKDRGGHIVLPSQDPAEHGLKYRHAHQGRDDLQAEVDLAIQEGRWVDMYTSATNVYVTDRWYHIAIYLLHLAGWTGVTRADLKLILIFDWR